MATLAIPAIRLMALRVLQWLGAAAAAGAAAEAARQRREEAENSKTTPIARTESPAKEKDRCEECPPDSGGLSLQPTAGWSSQAISYQRRIGAMPEAPPGYLFEWTHKGVKFDGFESGQCLLKEAKSTYDQFFNERGEFRYFFQEKIFFDMAESAMRQLAAAQPMPPTRLRWHFMEWMSFQYMQRVLSSAAPTIEVVYHP
ncbi:Tox-REase-5 domain-containing protein [Cupriavidus taiwanensis]|uniref:Tox-REase-5 domain-containing protein n=1 Tax=Cupriavidus taiwanensis TaxID=164546 RepID=UPI000E10295F|nr:Tox-REase-5 domain-containing protein [Cupriavidus taiwanensis]SOY50850.1 conserved exported hypothetical protein [Cupriavidus taiwanensis]SOY83733.1 conserved exported hypothetical protein [Cupriavidus taiwanensis]SOZ57968.1 conserved exported hypothetical protein [Cupriavidus taiwanensis]SOZ79770.1 conserved exported hypothetical protein [Cupriavidus taiwanensis]SOZ80419.1 conserved exported hypothetical protein [Cupriavidus taiwanensis]